MNTPPVSDRVAVRNAADPKQVRRAERQARDRDARLLLDVLAVMSTLPGRRVMWELLSRAGVFRSVWAQSALIHYNAGKQDFGHELMALLVKAGEDEYQQMEREARAEARREADGNEASHTPPATADTQENTE